MTRFRTQFRHLYLLALFQLVGGPLVLVALLSVVPTVVRETSGHGLAKGLERVSQSDTWQTVCSVMAGEWTAPEPAQKSPTAPEKAKHPSSKLDLAIWRHDSFRAPEGVSLGQPQWVWLHSQSQWAHAPPAPPPRGV